MVSLGMLLKTRSEESTRLEVGKVGERESERAKHVNIVEADGGL